MTRTGIAAAGMLLVGVVVLAVTLARPAPPPPAAPMAAWPPAGPVVRSGDAATLARVPHVLATRMSGGGEGSHLEIVSLADPAAPRAATTLECSRVSFAAGRGICLSSQTGMFTTYQAVLFDSAFRPTGTVKLQGTPSRTRVSPDGRYGSVTVFVTGAAHGYAAVGFSTKTILIEMATGKVIGDLEAFKTSRNGAAFAAADFNFWGVTFARDSNIFYASLLTGGKTYLVRGDVAQRTFAVLHEGVECPALSPDDRFIGFKKRVGGDLAPWRFHVLELATMSERPIAAEQRSIDDQLEWLDDGHVLYSTTRSSQSGIGDIWVAPIDGAEPARPLVAEAASPVIVR